MSLAVDPLDDFLTGAGAGSEIGERLETVGLFLTLPAIVVAVGLLMFVIFVHKDGSLRDRAAILRVLSYCGLLAFMGGFLEVVGDVNIGAGSWVEDLTETTRSSLIRLVAGALLTVGFLRVDAAVSMGRSLRQTAGLVGALVGALSFATDGHTVSQGNLVLKALLDVIHVLAAAAWVGGIAGLLILALQRRRRTATGSLVPAVVRFSTLATVAIVVVAAAGAAMSLLIVDSLGDYLTTAWGRWLLVKIGLVVVAGGLGAYNHYVVVPALDADPGDRPMLSRARATISAEAGLLLAVALVTVLLTGASIDQ